MFQNLSAATKPSPSAAKVKEVTLATFMADIIEPSKTNLVIVVFGSPRCGNCKQLMPLLEKTVGGFGGAVLLTAINAEAEPTIARQMGVQSVPATFAFFRGQPVDGFMGMVPESQIKIWLERLVKAVGAAVPQNQPAGIETALKQAEEFSAAGDHATAQSIYADLVQEFPESAAAYAGLVKTFLAIGEIEKARHLLSAAPKDILADKIFASVKSAVELAEQASASSGSLEAFKTALEKNPADLQARFDLALAYFAAGQREEAVDALLECVRRNRNWNEEAARKQLVKFFEAFGPTDPLTLSGRRRLSSILFA